MFAWLKNTFKMSQAAAVVQAALEQVEPVCFSEHSAKNLSSELVARTWQGRLDLFQGKNHPNLHRVSVAALSLALGLETSSEEDDRKFMFLALGQIILDVQKHGHKYSLGLADQNVLDVCAKSYTEYAEATQGETDQLLGSLDLKF